MKKKILLFLLVGSLALNLGFLAVYGRKYFQTPPPKATACPLTASYVHLYTFLGLDEEQLRRIETMAHGFHMRIEEISGLEKDATDRAAIDAIHRDIAALQSEMQELVVAHIIEMKGIMTPEQRSKFFTSMERTFALQDFAFSMPKEGMN